MKTAAIVVCTNRLQLAFQTLACLDEQNTHVDIYLVCNSNDPTFRSELIMLDLETMKKSVTFLALSAQHANIGLAVNCGLWHALNSGRHYDGFLKIDDDIFMDSDGLSHLWECCDGTQIVAYPPYAKGEERYDDPDAIRKEKIHSKCTSLYGACVLIPEVVITDCGYWAESAPRGGDTDYGIRAYHAGHDVIYHPTRVCIHLGANKPTEGLHHKYCARRVTTNGKRYLITIWNDATARAALLLDRFGWSGSD